VLLVELARDIRRHGDPVLRVLAERGESGHFPGFDSQNSGTGFIGSISRAFAYFLSLRPQMLFMARFCFTIKTREPNI
jgi:hypothetical protein